MKFDQWMTIESYDASVVAPPQIVIVEDLDYDPEADALRWSDGYTERYMPLENTTVTDEGLSGSFLGTKNTVIVRRVGPYDYTGRPGPLPVDAIVAALQEGEDMDPVLAIVDDNGYVVTLCQMAANGVWLRFDNAWQLVQPGQEEDPLDGANVVEVTDNAIDLFDSADATGQVLPVKGYPAVNPDDLGPYTVPTMELDDEIEAVEEPVVSAAEVLMEAVRPVLIEPIVSAADVPQAVAVAEEDPSVRWYVEKRAKALGWPHSFPWSN